MTGALAVLRTGLVTPVGLDAPSSCAAMRGKLANPSPTRFIDSEGEWIMGHEVPLNMPRHILPAKLVTMAAMAAREALQDIELHRWPDIALLLCVAEKERPGRSEGLDDRLLTELQRELGVSFDPRSAVVAHGRVSTAVALTHARTLVYETKLPHVLVVAADSLLTWHTLSHYERRGRLIPPTNSNGFMPGEGAGALLLGPAAAGPQLRCTGIGFGVEAAHVESDEPLRADGLAQAIKAAMADASCELHDMDLRIADLSGEHYYFKEAALALTRVLRRRKPEFDLWHPAESIGETGALAGVAMLALADAACRKAFTAGPAILVQMANDQGQRAAAALHFIG